LIESDQPFNFVIKQSIVFLARLLL